ncbi:Ig-like domain-containing protein [Bacillus pseudomycoides]|uniref:Ig-like domain-containing protein n=1 Tax=Bacillus pseudomycoides TaxID=64104 RepID=UPI00211E7824|nr:Ig-like domain-containing protein [Bacillus pseudomycoides]
MITGTTEPNTDVNVKVGSTLIGKGKANSKGQFSIKIPVQKMGTRVSVVVRDSAGNYSPSKVIEVSK